MKTKTNHIKSRLIAVGRPRPASLVRSRSTFFRTTYSNVYDLTVSIKNNLLTFRLTILIQNQTRVDVSCQTDESESLAPNTMAFSDHVNVLISGACDRVINVCLSILISRCPLRPDVCVRVSIYVCVCARRRNFLRPFHIIRNVIISYVLIKVPARMCAVSSSERSVNAKSRSNRISEWCRKLTGRESRKVSKICRAATNCS